MSLIATLKSQHETLRQSVQLIDEALAAGDPSKLRAALEGFTTLLSSHLQQEDAELYPGLVKAAQEKKDAHVERTAQLFSTNMARISESLSAFLRRQGKQQLQPSAFEREWRGFVAVLNQRLESEESALYPMYLRVTKVG